MDADLTSPHHGQRRRLRKAVAALSIFVVAAGVFAGTGHAQTAPATSPWHIFVYMVNDSEAVLKNGVDIDEMVAASRSGVNFTLYYDGTDAADPYWTSDYVPIMNEAVIVEISGGTATITQNLGEMDSGAPATLSWFISTGLAAHPAERTALVVAAHGDAWQGVGFDEDLTVNGATRDPSSLDAVEVGDAVDAGLVAAGREQFDLLAFGACAMGNLEVALESHGNARYLISSEELAYGFDYAAFSAFADPLADVPTIFTQLATSYSAMMESSTPEQVSKLTLSLVDLEQVSALGTALAVFSQAASVDVVANPQPYIDASAAAFHYGIDVENPESEWDGLIDLGEFLSRLSPVDAATSAARDQLLAALDTAVVAQATGTAVANATGFTVYLPVDPNKYDDDYDLLPLADAWRPFIAAFHDARLQALQWQMGFQAESPSVTPLGTGGYQLDAPVGAAFSGDVVMFASVYLSDGRSYNFDARPGSFATGFASGTFNPVQTTVTDGVNTAIPFTDYEFESDGTWHGYSRFTVVHADGTTSTMYWDGTADGSGVGTKLTDDGSGGLMPFVAAPGDIAYPVVWIAEPNMPFEDLYWTDVGLDPSVPWGAYDQRLPAGTTVYLELQLKDAEGTAFDTVVAEVQVG